MDSFLKTDAEHSHPSTPVSEGGEKFSEPPPPASSDVHRAASSSLMLSIGPPAAQPARASSSGAASPAPSLTASSPTSVVPISVALGALDPDAPPALFAAFAVHSGSTASQSQPADDRQTSPPLSPQSRASPPPPMQARAEAPPTAGERSAHADRPLPAAAASSDRLNQIPASEDLDAPAACVGATSVPSRAPAVARHATAHPDRGSFLNSRHAHRPSRVRDSTVVLNVDTPQLMQPGQRVEGWDSSELPVLANLHDSIVGQFFSVSDVGSFAVSCRPSPPNKPPSHSGSARLPSDFSSPMTHAFAVEFGRHRRAGAQFSDGNQASLSALGSYAMMEAPLAVLRISSSSAVNSFFFNEGSLCAPSQTTCLVGLETTSAGHSASVRQRVHGVDGTFPVVRTLVPASGRGGPHTDQDQRVARSLNERVAVADAERHYPLFSSDSSAHDSFDTSLSDRRAPQHTQTRRAVSRRHGTPPLAPPSPSMDARDAPHDEVGLVTAPIAPASARIADGEAAPARRHTLSPHAVCGEDGRHRGSRLAEDDSEAVTIVPTLLASTVCVNDRHGTSVGARPVAAEPTRVDVSVAGKVSQTAPPVRTRVSETCCVGAGPRSAPSAAESSAYSDGSIDTILARLQGIVPFNTPTGEARGANNIEGAAALSAAAAAVSVRAMPRTLRDALRAGQHTAAPPAALSAPLMASPSSSSTTSSPHSPTVASTIVPYTQVLEAAASPQREPEAGVPASMTTKAPNALVAEESTSQGVLLSPEYRATHSVASPPAHANAGSSGHTPRPANLDGIASLTVQDDDAPPRMRQSRKAARAAAHLEPTGGDESSGALRSSTEKTPTSARLSAVSQNSETKVESSGITPRNLYGRASAKAQQVLRRVRQPWVPRLVLPFALLLMVVGIGTVACVVVVARYFLWGQLSDIHVQMHAKATSLVVRNGVLATAIPDAASAALEVVGPLMSSSEEVARRLCITAARHTRFGFPIGLSYISGIPEEPIVYCAPFALQRDDDLDADVAAIPGDTTTSTSRSSRTTSIVERAFVRLVRDAETGLYNGLYTVDDETFTLITPPRLVELFPGRRPYTEAEVIAWLGFRQDEVMRNRTVDAPAPPPPPSRQPRHAGKQETAGAEDSAPGTRDVELDALTDGLCEGAATNRNGTRLGSAGSPCRAPGLSKSTSTRAVTATSSGRGRRAHTAGQSGPEFHYTRLLVERPHPARDPVKARSVISYISSHVPFEQLLQDADVYLFEPQANLLRDGGASQSARPMKTAGVILISTGTATAEAATHTSEWSHRSHRNSTSGRGPSPFASSFPSGAHVMMWPNTNLSFRILGQRWVVDAARGIFTGEPMRPLLAGALTPNSALTPFAVSADYLNDLIASIRPSSLMALLSSARTLEISAPASFAPAQATSPHASASVSHTFNSADSPSGRGRDRRREKPNHVGPLTHSTLNWRSHKRQHHAHLAMSVSEVRAIGMLSAAYEPAWLDTQAFPTFFTLIITPPELVLRSAWRSTIGLMVIGAVVVAVVATVAVAQDAISVLIRRPLLRAVEDIELATALIDRPCMALDAADCDQVSAVHAHSDVGGAHERKEAFIDEETAPLNSRMAPLIARIEVAEFTRLAQLCARMYHRTRLIQQFLPEYFFPQTAPARKSKQRSRSAPRVDTSLPPGAETQENPQRGVRTKHNSSKAVSRVRRATRGIPTSAEGTGSRAAASPDIRGREGHTGASDQQATNDDKEAPPLDFLESHARDTPDLVNPLSLSQHAAGVAPDDALTTRASQRCSVVPLLTTVEVPAALRVISRSPPARDVQASLESEPSTAAAQARRSTMPAVPIPPMQPRRALTATLPVVLQTHAGALSESNWAPPNAPRGPPEHGELTSQRASWYGQCFCSTISIHHEVDFQRNVNSPDMSRFMELIVDMIDKYDVNTDILSPEIVALSVGSRTTVKDHALVATHCAIELFQSVPRSIREEATFVVDSGVFNYGVCGVPQHRGFVMWGRPSGELLHTQQKATNLPFLVTDTVAPLIQSHYRVLPIDFVQIVQESNSPQIIIYALYEGSAKASAWIHFAARYTEAFLAFFDGHYERAVAQLEPLLTSPFFPAIGAPIYAWATQHALKRRVRRHELSAGEADASYRVMLEKVLRRLQDPGIAFPFGQDLAMHHRPVKLQWSIPSIRAYLSVASRLGVAMPDALQESPLATHTQGALSVELWSDVQGSSPSSSSLMNDAASSGDERLRVRSYRSTTVSVHSVTSVPSTVRCPTRLEVSASQGLPAVQPSDVVWIFDPLENTGTFRALIQTRADARDGSPARISTASPPPLWPAAVPPGGRKSDDTPLGDQVDRVDLAAGADTLIAPAASSIGDDVGDENTMATAHCVPTHSTGQVVRNDPASATSSHNVPRQTNSSTHHSQSLSARSWMPLPNTVSDLNGNVWQRSRACSGSISVHGWVHNYRGMSETGAMVELLLCRFGDVNDPEPNTDTVPLAATAEPLGSSRSRGAGRDDGDGINTGEPDSTTISTLVSRESLHYMEIVCEAFYHENIHQLLSVALVPHVPCLCLISEYEPGPTLWDTICQFHGALPTATVYQCCAAILSALEFLHNDKGTIHGVLSPKNVVLGMDGQCKLQRMAYLFGWAASAPAIVQKLIAEFEVAYYLSPEVLLGGAKDSASDMYAFGLTLLALLVGEAPWTWSGARYGPLSRRSQEELSSVLSNRRLLTQSLLAGDILLRTYGPHMNSYNKDLRRTYGGDNASSDTHPTLPDSDDVQSAGASALPREAGQESATAHSTPMSEAIKSAALEYDGVLLEVLEACLALEPRQRKTAAEVLQILSKSPSFQP